MVVPRIALAPCWWQGLSCSLLPQPSCQVLPGPSVSVTPEAFRWARSIQLKKSPSTVCPIGGDSAGRARTNRLEILPRTGLLEHWAPHLCGPLRDPCTWLGLPMTMDDPSQGNGIVQTDLPWLAGLMIRPTCLQVLLPSHTHASLLRLDQTNLRRGVLMGQWTPGIGVAPRCQKPRSTGDAICVDSRSHACAGIVLFMVIPVPQVYYQTPGIMVGLFPRHRDPPYLTLPLSKAAERHILSSAQLDWLPYRHRR